MRRSTGTILTVLLILGAVLAPATAPAAQSTLTSPSAFFGHEMGADRLLARWDRIVEYFRLLESQSDRLQVVDLGPTTMGHPFLLVIVSSPENLANLDRIAEASRALADPRGLDGVAVEALIAEGKAVVAQSLGLHSTEVAGAQAGPEIAWDLVSRDDPETLRILDETVLLLLPCINPDGQIMVADWVRETVDTEFEGAGLPQLYHLYAGHDNNRDGDYLNLVESGYMARVLYREWKPQAYVDHHQMGPYGPRMYVPPYSEPIRPGADPLMWRELAWYGAHIATKLEENGRAGILNAGQYPGWGHFGWHWITPFHNIAGMLTESASATLATPLFIHPDQLQGGARGLPEYEAQSNMPNPWPGGWWRVRDIVVNQVIAARALQDHAARNRETVLRNAYLKAARQTERGAAGTPKAWIVPATQHDLPTAAKMIDTLLLSDIEIWRAEAPFTVEGMGYEAGSWIVPAAQPKIGLVRNLLARTLYPDNTWTRARDGSPLSPYDTATHTMAELMGVRVDEVEAAVDGAFTRLAGPVAAPGSVADAGPFVLDGRENASYRAVNRLLAGGVTVQRVTAPTGQLRPGDFVVAEADDASAIAAATGATFAGLASMPEADVVAVRRPRIGMYQRFGGGNMDEGWTRLVLEQFDFAYATLQDAEIKAGNLRERYDVVVLPEDSTRAILGGEPEGPFRPWVQPPPQYRSGIGEEGVQALDAFVRAGGTLVTLGSAAHFAVEKLGVGVIDAVADVPETEFFCPGSTLRLTFDTGHPLAWGMPAEGIALFFDSPVFAVRQSAFNQRYSVPARYADRDILQSGWLVGEQHLSGRAAVVDAELGDGRVVLLGIRAQHRAQTHGTYKLLFNALLR